MTTKYCKDCTNAVNPRGATPWMCHRPTGHNPVDGSPMFVDRPCKEERVGGDRLSLECGPTGYHFVQKPEIPKK